MEFRNIRRAFLMPKALTKFHKKNDRLTHSDVNVLYCVHVNMGEDAFVSVHTIGKTLAAVNREQNSSELYRTCEKLRDEGYLLVADLPVKKYKLSLLARNYLGGLEEVLKKERWNR